MTESDLSHKPLISQPEVQDQLNIAHHAVERMDVVYTAYQEAVKYNPNLPDQQAKNLKNDALTSLAIQYYIFIEGQLEIASTGYRSQVADDLVRSHGIAYHLLIREEDPDGRLGRFLKSNSSFTERIGGWPEWLPQPNQK